MAPKLINIVMKIHTLQPTQVKLYSNF